MKKVISSILVMMLLFVTAQSFAQLNFGVKAGLNLANMTAKDKDNTWSDDYSMKTGFHLGVTAGFSIMDNLFIEPGLLFSTKGFKVDEDGGNYTFNMNYLDIPINAIYKIDLGCLNVFVHTGPYFGYAISGKMKSDDKIFMTDNFELTDEQDIEIGSDEAKDDIKALDIGWNIGAGVEISGITVGIQYGLGLANLSPSTANETVAKNKVIGISVGYNLTGKK